MTTSPETADPTVLQAVRDGVDALRSVAERLDAADWDRPSACEGWLAVDLAGHVVWVARLWHEFLDRAEAGDASTPFAWSDFDAKNAEALAALPVGTGPDRIQTFTAQAHAWVDRTPALWSLPIGSPVQDIATAPLTVGLFAACIAPLEWHLHAWDLAWAIAETYRPAKPELLLERAQTVLPVPPLDGDAWENILLFSGRQRG